MRILLLHPEDDPAQGSWTRESWDRIVDIAAASEQARSHWGDLLGCRVEALPNSDIQAVFAVREALSFGLGYVVDRCGLDWWELIAMRFCDQFEILTRLRRLAASISTQDELFVTRNSIQASLLGAMGFEKVKCLGVERSYLQSFGWKIAAAGNFYPSQLIQILKDKYDPTYRIRRLTTSPLKQTGIPAVLLPVAHVNAARTAISYAAMLPEQKFLLVATRQNGWIGDCPANVAASKLAAYAPGRCNLAEQQELFARWRHLEGVLKQNADTSVLLRLGLFTNAAKSLKNGLIIRDSWLRVFTTSPVAAVLCTDTTNPNTHIPLLLARNKHIPTVACHHGALDGYYRVKRNHADVILAKGEMERDYLKKTCGIAEGKIECGGHDLPPRKRLKGTKNAIVFFSEPYALGAGRCRDIYREVLPRLAELARRLNLQLVVKLHPMESRRERTKLAEAALSGTERAALRIQEGPLTDDLLDGTRFAVTVQSTAAVDCAIRGIPVFLCCWLGYSHYYYAEQFVKFGAGMPLSSATEISAIPHKLDGLSPPASQLWETISQEKLRSLLQPLRMAAAV